MNWFGGFLANVEGKLEIDKESLRAKAREAVKKLPPPAPMVIGPNVLAPIKKKGMENQMGAAVLILGLVGQTLDSILSHGTKSNWPKDIMDAVIAAATAIGTAHTLAVTKAGLEANRQ